MITVVSKTQKRGDRKRPSKPAARTQRGKSKALLTAIAGICLAWLALYPTGTRGAEDPVALFDAHLHYNEPAWLAFDPEYIQQMFDRNGVSGALVSSTPDDGTLMLFKADPKRFVPELRPYRGDVNAGNWTKDPGVVALIEERIEKTPYAGIGEIHIYKMSDVDWDLVKKVAAIARKKDIFLHVHSESPAIERIFELEPELTIVWAHAGFYDGAEIIGKMLDKYDRLIAEMSLRAPNILSPKGGFAPGWKELLLRHQDRIVVGTDTYINLAWAEYDELVAQHREWLDKLPRDAAENIAHKNAQRLLAKRLRD